MSAPTGYEGWAIVELMGHRRLAGFVSEATMAGAAMLRIDVPGEDGATVATQFYGGSALYCVTPTTEAIARAVAKGSQPTPATRWELSPPKRTTAAPVQLDDDDAETDGDEPEDVDGDDVPY